MKDRAHKEEHMGRNGRQGHIPLFLTHDVLQNRFSSLKGIKIEIEKPLSSKGKEGNMPQEPKKNTLISFELKEGSVEGVNVRILREFQSNPRITMSELARRVGMSSPAVSERVRRMEKTGVIRGYRLDVDPTALGLPVAAYIPIRPNPGQLARIAELARQIPQITECHRVTGEDCFILKVHIPAINQLDRLLDLFLAHGSTTTSIIQS
jgi:Lrp/AsnC family leucine-responsive transcriptional regulator